jgi:hypothetical protein
MFLHLRPNVSTVVPSLGIIVYTTINVRYATHVGRLDNDIISGKRKMAM